LATPQLRFSGASIQHRAIAQEANFRFRDVS